MRKRARCAPSGAKACILVSVTSNCPCTMEAAQLDIHQRNCSSISFLESGWNCHLLRMTGIRK